MGGFRTDLQHMAAKHSHMVLLNADTLAHRVHHMQCLGALAWRNGCKLSTHPGQQSGRWEGTWHRHGERGVLALLLAVLVAVPAKASLQAGRASAPACKHWLMALMARCWQAYASCQQGARPRRGATSASAALRISSSAAG